MVRGRRRNNEGTIRKRKDGRWEVAITLPDGKRKSLYAPTYAEVNTKRIEALRDIQHGLPLPSEKLTVGAYLASWLESLKATALRETTWVRYETTCRTQLVPGLGHVSLSKLTAYDLNGFYTARLQAGMSPNAVRCLHTTLHIALHAAQRVDLVMRNVADMASPPAAEEPRRTPYTPEQAKRFLEVIQGNRFEALYYLAILLGMREGELLSLTWDTVDLEQGTLDIRSTQAWVRGHWIVNPPKTKKGQRLLPLNPVLLRILHEHRVRQVEERLRLGPAWTDHNLIFPRENGDRMDGSLFYKRRYLPLLRKAGLPQIRFHDLRHTMATLLLSLGVKTKVVSEMLGHAHTSITENIYQHVDLTMMREAQGLISRLLDVREDGHVQDAE